MTAAVTAAVRFARQAATLTPPSPKGEGESQARSIAIAMPWPTPMHIVQSA